MNNRASCAGLILCGFIFTSLTISAQADPAMWVIRDKDSTIYLIGTIHLLKHETEWDQRKAKKALADSNELWLEISDFDNQTTATQLFQQYGIDREKSLSSKLNTTQKEKLEKVAEKYHFPLSNLEPMKPWMAATIITILPLQEAGYDPNAGVDHILQKEARKKGEKIRGFETSEQQIQFFADLSESDQIAFLENTLDDTDKGIDKLDELAKAWLKGDTRTIAEFLVKEFKAKVPATLYQKLIVQRNERWSEKIVEILNGSGVQVIAVGAGHLTGPDSVQAQLAKHGVKVEPY
jgi:uncharacterized protein YbaP (TraB family)